jgi:PiT family inorganic phosphate transporter
MLVHFMPSSGIVVAMLVVCLVMVLAFEATNGFHDSSNAVATVIYTQSLGPVPAVIWSGLMNFIGVLVGGISVGYALVEILPPDVLTPPDGSPAVPMLVSIFAAALFWNILTWAFAIPNSSSHCIIGALIGVAAAEALLKARSMTQGRGLETDRDCVEGACHIAGPRPAARRRPVRHSAVGGPPRPSARTAEREPPVWGLRGLLILTCTTQATGQMTELSQNTAAAIPLIQQYGDDVKAQALKSAALLQNAGPVLAGEAHKLKTREDIADSQQTVAVRAQLRGAVYDVLSELKHVGELPGASAADKAKAGDLLKQMAPPVQYAPWWVRVLSALCLGIGTMIGYKRVVRTLGERLGKQYMTPGQGASAELVGSVLIGTAGLLDYRSVQLTSLRRELQARW